MKSTKAYSLGLKELRLKLGIRPSPPRTQTDERTAAFSQRVKEVAQKSRKRSEIPNDRKRGPQYRWTGEEDQKLMRSRASGLEWTSIAKELHRSPGAVKKRFLRLLARRSWP
jgi:DNA-binding NarL/FixJ family response regulator